MSPAEMLAEKLRSGVIEEGIPVNGRFICKLASLRTAIGLSQSAAANGLGLNQSQLSRFEGGGRPSLAVALRIAKFFGKPVEEIWSLRGNVTPEATP